MRTIPTTTINATTCTNFCRFLNTRQKPNLQFVNFYQYVISRLFRSARTKQSGWSIGFWAALTAIGYLRRRTAPTRGRLIRKNLKPGASYIVRVPPGTEPVVSDLSSITGDLIKDTPISRRQLKKLERERR